MIAAAGSVMQQAASPLLDGWANFYVIVGSAAAALTGLQFVVIALTTELNSLGSGSATRSFATPTIFHFCAVLYVAAIVSAPWPTLLGADLALGAGGVAGFAYAVFVTRHMAWQNDYAPVLEDWIWHSALPLLAYAALLLAAVLLERYPTPCLFVIAAAALLLLFVGIHNAWDSALYIALQRRRPPEQPPASHPGHKTEE